MNWVALIFTQEVIGPQNALPAIFQIALITYKLTYIVLSPLSGPGLVKSCGECQGRERCGFFSQGAYLAKKERTENLRNNTRCLQYVFDPE